MKHFFVFYYSDSCIISFHSTDGERWYWQFYFGSYLTIVSLLCLMISLRTILYLNDGWRSSYLFNRTNNIHMTTSASLRLNISCIMFQTIAFFYVMVGILHVKSTCITTSFRQHWRFGTIRHRFISATFYWYTCTKPEK